MLYKLLGIILILLGITGAIIPVMPCIPFLIVGVLLLYKDKLHELRKGIPEEFPSLLAGMYGAFVSKMFAPYHKKICDSITLSDGSILLDIGTGPGTLPIAIAGKFPSAKVIGIDLSKKMIQIAEKNRQMSGAANNLEFKVMDAKNLAFCDNSLDMVISTGSMHHWKDPVKIFNELYRCLKPGCEAWIYDGYGNAADEDINRELNKFFGSLPTPRMARAMLRLHGYTQAEYDTIIKDHVAKSAFRTCAFDKAGIMMRIVLSKPL